MKKMYKVDFHFNEIKEIEVKSETESFVQIAVHSGRTQKETKFYKTCETFEQAIVALEDFHKQNIKRAIAVHDSANYYYQQFKAKYKS